MMMQPIRNYVLGQFSELRLVSENFFTPMSIKPSITLLNLPTNNPSFPGEMGTAEVFGRELVPDVEFPIGEGERLAVYTWIGCSIQVKGVLQQEYEAYDNSMKEYLNVINALDVERESAAIKRINGPRVLVTGAPSSGKSSFCSILCNYALRNGWTPVFVEADPRASTDKRNLQFYPGTIGATVVSGLDDDSPRNPLIYFYGYTDIQENETLYIHMCKVMSVSIELMMEQNLKLQPQHRHSDEVNDMGKYISASGMIINAPYQASKSTIIKLSEIFNVSMIIVIDSPSIHQALVKNYAVHSQSKTKTNDTGNLEFVTPALLTNLAFQKQPNDNNDTAQVQEQEVKEDAKPEILVLGASKLEGVVSVDNDRLKYLNYVCWKKYFELTSGNYFHVIRFKMENVNFVFIDTIAALTKDAFPTDEEYAMKAEELYASNWTGDPLTLNNAIVAIPTTEELNLIPYCNISGFFHIRNVEVNEKRINYNEEDGDEETVEKVYTIEAACHSSYTPTSLPKFLIVPCNLRALKWIQ